MHSAANELKYTVVMERTAQAFPCLWVSASPWLWAIPAVALSIHAEHSCRADSVWSQAECLGWPESIGDQCPGGPSPFHPFSFCGQPGQLLVAGNLSISRFVRSLQGVEPLSSFDRPQLCKPASAPSRIASAAVAGASLVRPEPWSDCFRWQRWFPRRGGTTGRQDR